MPRGFFISLDGIDGAGKSTQCRWLADWLRAQGREVVECADPGGTDVGKVLRDLLLNHRGRLDVHCEAMLFMASRAQLVAEVICPALESGRTVVCDRFVLANVVYQGYGGGLDPDRIREVGLWATEGLEPDLTFVLDLPLDVARSRRKSSADRLERRQDEYHERVRGGFLAEAGKHPERILVIDALTSPEAVRDTLREAVRSRLLNPNQPEASARALR